MKTKLLTLLIFFVSWGVQAQTFTGKVTIDDNALCTNERQYMVKLRLEASGAKEMRISNINQFGPRSPWVPFSTEYEWKLDHNNGDKTVYVMFKNAKGDVSPVATDAILLDTQPPIPGPMKINGGESLTHYSEVLLHFNAREADYMWISNSPEFDDDTNWEPYNKVKHWNLLAGEGKRTVYVQFKDGCGNVGRPISARIAVQYQ